MRVLLSQQIRLLCHSGMKVASDFPPRLLQMGEGEGGVLGSIRRELHFHARMTEPEDGRIQFQQHDDKMLWTKFQFSSVSICALFAVIT